MNHIRYGLVARICRSHQRVAGKARVQFPVSEIIFFALFSPFFRLCRRAGVDVGDVGDSWAK